MNVNLQVNTTPGDRPAAIVASVGPFCAQSGKTFSLTKPQSEVFLQPLDNAPLPAREVAYHQFRNSSRQASPAYLVQTGERAANRFSLGNSIWTFSQVSRLTN